MHYEASDCNRLSEICPAAGEDISLYEAAMGSRLEEITYLGAS
jgi:hypothetical protein